MIKEGDYIKVEKIHPQSKYFEKAVKEADIKVGEIYEVVEVNYIDGWFDFAGKNGEKVTCYLDNDKDITFEVGRLGEYGVGDYVIIDEITNDIVGWEACSVHTGKPYQITRLDANGDNELDAFYFRDEEEGETLCYIVDDPDFVFRLLTAEEVANMLKESDTTSPHNNNLKVEELLNIVKVDLKKRVGVDGCYLIDYCPDKEYRYNTLLNRTIDCLCEMVAINNLFEEKRNVIDDLLTRIEEEKATLEGVDLYYEN